MPNSTRGSKKSLPKGKKMARKDHYYSAAIYEESETGGEASTVDRLKLAMVGPIGPRHLLYHASLFLQEINGVDRAEWEAAGFYYTEGKPFRDARVVAVWCPEREEAVLLSKLCHIPKVVDHYQDLVGEVDGVIVCNAGTMQRHAGRGESSIGAVGNVLLHGTWARHFVEHRVPTFIDKPIAGTLAEAEELVALAKNLDAPMMSCSGLRYSSVLWEKAAEIQALGKIWLANGTCPFTETSLAFYGVHGLEPAHSLLGGGVEWVQNIGSPLKHVLRAAYPDGRSIVLECISSIYYTQHLSLFGEHGYLDLELLPGVELHQQFFHRKMLHTFVEMVRTKKRPIDLDHTLEINRILYLGDESLKRGGERLCLKKQ